MEEFRVIEHKSDPDEQNKMFVIKAINFVSPTYLTILSTKDIIVGEKLLVDGNEVSYGKEVIGKVVRRQDGTSAKINTDYDIKYNGGYSRDGKTLYIARDLPKELNIDGKVVNILESVGRHHELPEKWLSDDAYEYPYAHETATGIEKEYVESLGIKWERYDEELGKQLHIVYEKKLAKSPKDLDLAPYLYGHDQAALKEIRESMEI
ncbi:MAG: hypothetical protein QXN59_00445 [Candidatus Micrarchaeaceae archaeon]